ncbi:hypothetical protein [Microbacterium tenebrionis]|uniref:hypothetical protein n=1 Tax=Microbacterium tenebrionis TaxID=2830665 RepID=UPI00158837E2|nr:hypothetical protein [Microbacterium ihumii]
MTDQRADSEGAGSDGEKPVTEPTTDKMQEPSTEKEPGDEPRQPVDDDAEPSHEAVGIGVIGRPLTEPDAATDS